VQKVSDEDFIAAWRRYGSPQKVADALGLAIRGVYQRRKTLADRLGLNLTSFGAVAENTVRVGETFHTIEPDSRNLKVDLRGVVVVFSDAHYWPGEPTEAHRAMLRLIRKLHPVAIIANGDVFDGARISRHDPMGWQSLPSVREELDAATDRMTEIEKAAPNAKLFWPIGNHDLRFDKYIAMHARELHGAPGARLADHFPRWKMVWSLHINRHTVVKHSWHNGIHATYNNTLKGGTSVVTGHLHRLQVTAWGDYNGRRYGVDTGTLAEPAGEQFEYLQGNATPWGNGFAVLTFDEDGQLLPPELCEVIKGVAYFRGRAV
jgi:hypothetical protein